jgi:putative intracellular protease/amidase
MTVAPQDHQLHDLSTNSRPRIGMAKTVLAFLMEGVEEIEFVTPVDIWRRAGFEVTVASLGWGAPARCHYAPATGADGVLRCGEAERSSPLRGAPTSRSWPMSTWTQWQHVTSTASSARVSAAGLRPSASP